MEFDQLKTLLAVLEHGSFTRAAEVLRLSQSTVSFHIKALETVAGHKLIDRGRDGVELTAHGRILRGYAQRILALRTEAEEALQALQDGLIGHIVVAASTIPGEHLLPSSLAALRNTHPGVSVSVAVSDSQGAVAALLAGRADLALVGGLPRDRRLTAVPMGDDEIVLIGPPDGRYPVPPDGRLVGLPLVLRTEGSGTREAVADVLSASLVGGEPASKVEVGSTVAVVRCVEAGLGLGFVSRIAIAPDLAAGRVALVEHPRLPVRRTFHALCRTSVTPSPAAAALLEILGERG